MRVVLDSNVLLAAFAFGGICRAVVEVCIDGHDVFLSEHILAEVDRHLRSKFQHDAASSKARTAFLR